MDVTTFVFEEQDPYTGEAARLASLLDKWDIFTAQDDEEDEEGDEMGPVDHSNSDPTDFRHAQSRLQDASQSTVDQPTDFAEAPPESIFAWLSCPALSASDPFMKIGPVLHNRFTNMSEKITEEQTASRGANRLKTHLAAATEPFSSDKKSAGHKRLANVMTILDSFGFDRSAEQRLFHQWYIQAALPFIYGKDWNTSQSTVLESIGLKRIDDCVLCMAPRRFGKTWAIAMLCASLLLAVPGIKICVFSTGKRASNSLMKEVKRFVDLIPGGTSRVIVENQEHLHIAPREVSRKVGWGNHEVFKEHEISVLNSYPGTVDGKCLFVVIAVHCEGLSGIRQSSHKNDGYKKPNEHNHSVSQPPLFAKSPIAGPARFGIPERYTPEFR